MTSDTSPASAAPRVEVVLAEGLVIGPNDKLVIKIDRNAHEEFRDALAQALADFGLRDRAIVIMSEETIELAKVEA